LSTPTLFTYTTLFRSFSKQNKTEGKRHLVYMLLFRLNGLRAAWAARGAAHCAALQTMHLSAHCVGGSAPAQLYSSFVVVLVFRLDRKSTRLNSSHVSI